MRLRLGCWFDTRPPRLLPWAGLLLALAAAPLRADSPGGGGDPGPAPRVRSASVTILSTMLADTKGLGEWGFAALVEADGHRLLFDTGARPETVLTNARELGIDLAGVTDVVLSHHHGDHTGGLLTLRRELMKANPAALSRCFVGSGIFLPRPGVDGREANETIALKGPYEASGGRFVEVARPTEVFPGAWLTGPVPRTHPERNWSGRGQVRTSEGLVEDTIPEDMALVLDTAKGLVVVDRLRPRRGGQHAGIRARGGPAGPGPRGRGRPAPVRGRRGDAGLDGGQAQGDGPGSPARGPLHGRGVGLRAPAAAGPGPADLRGRGGGRRVRPGRRDPAGDDRPLTPGPPRRHRGPGRGGRPLPDATGTGKRGRRHDHRTDGGPSVSTPTPASGWRVLPAARWLGAYRRPG